MAWLGFMIAPLCFAGFAAMAMSMDRHHRDAVGGPCPGPLRGRLRRLGWSLLATAAAIALIGHSVGIVVGVLSASMAAAAVVGVLGLRPRVLARLMAIPVRRGQAH
jgi:hypothetical protein